jgi:squamous cell carcinoma antigen recognized by T-cells 3
MEAERDDAAGMLESVANDVSSSEESSSVNDEQTAKVIQDARAAVSAAPHSYQAHERLVGLLRAEDLDALRTAREHFASAFPLPPAVWLEWIDDEARIATTSDDRARIAKTLFPRAMGDYLSVKVAVAYIQFQGCRLLNGEIDLDEVKACFEPLVTRGGPGCAFPDGVRVWRAYRDVMKMCGAATTEDCSRILARQLTYHLAGNECDREANVAESGHPSADSRDVDDLLKVFEAKLVSAGSSREDYFGVRTEMLESQFIAYAASEEERDALSARVVWERCVAECFLHPAPWLAYAEYCRRLGERSTDIEDGLELSIVERGLRNIPWCMGLWTALVRATERSGVQAKLPSAAVLAKLAKVVERATPNVMHSEDTVGAERLAIKIVQVFYRCGGTLGHTNAGICQTAMSYNEAGTVPWAVVKCMVASLEETAEVALQTMEEVVSARPGESRWWIEFERLLEARSDDASVRQLFQRAISAALGNFEIGQVGQAWLSFEGRHCKVSVPAGVAYDAAQNLIDSRLGFAERTATALVSGGSRMHANHSKRGPPPLQKPRKRKRRIESKAPADESAANPGEDSKMGHGREEEHAGQEELTMNANTAATRHDKREAMSDVAVYEPNVVYVNNLSWTVTVDELRAAFAPAGTVEDVRLPRRKDGALKGFAYVEFADDADVDAAVALNKMQISGREAWVRRSKPPKPKPGGKVLRGVTKRQDASGSDTARDGAGVSRNAASGATMKPRLALSARSAGPAGASASGFRGDSGAHGRDADDEKMGDDRGAMTAEEERKPLGQDDFRAMLLRKK